jgi:hypothetical protein
MATSFVAPFPHRPVLSPTVHVFGTPARIISEPVSLSAIWADADFSLGEMLSASKTKQSNDKKMDNAQRPTSNAELSELSVERWALSVGRWRSLTQSPSVIGGMAFFHRHKHAPACSANLSAGAQCSLDGRTVISDLDNLRREKNGVVCRGRP